MFKSILNLTRNKISTNIRFLSSVCDKIGISSLGIHNPETIYHNLSYSELFQHEQDNREGIVMDAKYGVTFSVDTGKFTGRSPKDKWIVKNIDSTSDSNLWWGDINQPTSPEVFDKLYDKAIKHFNTLDRCYVFDGYCGANPNSQKKVRFVHELAWQQHFVTNMFIRPETREEIQNVAAMNYHGSNIL